MNILHILYTALPEVSGYAIRTDNVLNTLKLFNINSYPLVYENIVNDYPTFSYNEITYFQYNTILRKYLLNKISNKYDRLKGLFKNLLLIYETIFQVPQKKILKMIKKNKIDIIHGYSPYYFSKFGVSIKKKIDIPFIYEKRGFWEFTNLVEETYSSKSLIYKWDYLNEQNLMRKADKLITLSNQMRKELVKMGISRKKIEVIYNCVNVDEFKPQEPNKALIKKLNLRKKRIIGYIGNIRKLEGIEYLLKAFAKISNKFKNLIVLLVGRINSDLKIELNKLIHELGIEGKVIFTGIIPYKEIKEYYSIFDILIIPRINVKVCNLVTPQKPLEILAMQKLLIVSDVKGLTEIVKSGISGDIFHSENVEDLAEKISFYLENPEKKKEVERKSREYILEKFTCKNQFKKYIEIYESLI